MSKPEKPKQAIPVGEPFDVWWPKYIKRVNESVTAAEQYLEVPTGTISSIQADPDFIATVKTYAVIEPMLNDLISARPPTSCSERWQLRGRTRVFKGLSLG